MKFFVDTGDFKEIEELSQTGLLDGVTTNPSLVAKSGRDFKELIAEICKVVPGPVSAEVAATDFDGMMAYYDAVRKETLRYLDTLKAEDLDRCPDERRPSDSIGKALSHVIVEEAQHVGQIAYIRGIQRGIDK